MSAQVTYDAFGHVYVVRLAEGEFARTQKFDESHLVDVAADGSGLGD